MSVRRRPRRSPGYTMVELMISIAILAIGASGVLAMQAATITSNRHARELAVATRIAQAWEEALLADAALWNQPSAVAPMTSDIATDTVWLRLAGSAPVAPAGTGSAAVAAEGPWVFPTTTKTWAERGQIGHAFDALGRAVDSADPDQIAFCVNLRLTWLFADTQPVPGNGLIRAEVRVYWPRTGFEVTGSDPGVELLGQGFCNPSDSSIPAKVSQSRAFHFVHHVTAVRQQASL